MTADYVVHWNASTTDQEAADAAALAAGRLVEGHRCRLYAARSGPVYDGISTGRVRFRAASDAEAQGIVDRLKVLPGLPPIDAVSWRRI